MALTREECRSMPPTWRPDPALSKDVEFAILRQSLDLATRRAWPAGLAPRGSTAPAARSAAVTPSSGRWRAGVLPAMPRGCLVSAARAQGQPLAAMPHHGMTPHISGSSLPAQARSAAGTREILECWFDKRPIREEYLIVDGGNLAGTGARSDSAGDATRGSEEATTFPTRSRTGSRAASGSAERDRRFAVRASNADIPA
jgi:hypothetical protein